MDVDMISKQKDKMNKTTKIGLMGVCSNYHMHKNNQVYGIFKIKMITKVGIIPNSDHEIRKIKTKNDICNIRI